MSLLWLLPAAAVLFLITLLLVCRKAFYSPDKTQENIYNIPENEQYSPYHSQMTALIDDLSARPFEPVSITSHDGLTLYGRYYHYADDALRAVAHTKYPILILHGEDDRFVPCEMSRALAAVNPSIELHTFPGAGHGISDIVHTDRYTEIVTRFIQTHCPSDTQN